MNRRIFLKKGGMALAGIFSAPFLLESCFPKWGTGSGTMAASASAVPDFMGYAELFDQSVAELRFFGAGPIIPAEAEAFQFGLDDVAEQVVGGAEFGPEGNGNFESYGHQMLTAAAGLAEVSAEFPLIEGGEYNALSEDYALLKVAKASAVLNSAAEATFPHPERMSSTTNMLAESMAMHHALKSPNMAETANAELAHSAEQLLGHAETFIGGSEILSSTQEFYYSSAEFAGSLSDSDDLGDFANKFLTAAQGLNLTAPSVALANFQAGFSGAEDLRIARGNDWLLAAAESISLSAGILALGVETYNQGEQIVGAEGISTAASWASPSAELITGSERYTVIARGEAAQSGAAEMVSGAELIQAESATDAGNVSGAEFLLGAEQFIGGTTNFYGSVSYTAGSFLFLKGAESFSGGNAAGEKLFLVGSERSFVGADHYELGAEVLESIELPFGAENVMPAAERIYSGAEMLGAIARGAEAIAGAETMMLGAELMVAGAAEAVQAGAEFMEGSIEILQGSSELNSGAAEFAQAE